MLSHSVQPESGELIRSNRRATSHTCLLALLCARPSRVCEAASAGGPCYSFEKITERLHTRMPTRHQPTQTHTNATHAHKTHREGLPFLQKPSLSSEWTLMEFQECQPNSRGSLASNDPLEISERPLCSVRTLPLDVCFEWPLGTP